MAAPKVDASMAAAIINEPLPEDKKLPVTLLSGFLGAGKTTLLTNLLRSQAHKMRIGIIVNDIGQLNIDGALLNTAQSKLTDGKETSAAESTTATSGHQVSSMTKERGRELQKIVEMQNGCICCTLRPELLSQVAEMAKEGRVDYLVIESSGVSEPMQVAETFAPEFTDMMRDAAEQMAADANAAANGGADSTSGPTLTEEEKKDQATLASLLAAGGLPSISRLDTCVTVVDAANVFNDFATADFLVDRHGKEGDVPEEDDRNISDLMVDQLEFADVVVLNKCDLVDAEEITKVLSLIKTLNPTAHIIQATQGKIDPREVIDTKRFSYSKAAMAAGWLRSLQEEVVPETEEYGIGTFVYRARRPFHPKRLWQAIRKAFVVIQEEFIDDGVDAEAKSEDGEAEGEGEKDVEMEGGDQSANSSDEGTVKTDSTTHKADSGVDMLSNSSDSVSGSGGEDGEDASMQRPKKSRKLANEGAIDGASTPVQSGDKNDTEAMDEDQDEDGDGAAQPQLNPKARLAAKKASATWNPLLRSKGFFWLATRPSMYGEWSQAGVMLTLSGAGAWRCTLPREEWSPDNDADVIASIEGDFQGEYGDRRQELVFIGLDMAAGKERITKAMDACLLDDDEMEVFNAIMRGGKGGNRAAARRNKKKNAKANSTKHASSTSNGAAGSVMSPVKYEVESAASLEAKQAQLQEVFEDGFEDWRLDDGHGHDHDHDHDHDHAHHH